MIFLAPVSALTLNPIIKALDVVAKLISDSLIPPTPEDIISTTLSSVDSYNKESLIASTLP